MAINNNMLEVRTTSKNEYMFLLKLCKDNNIPIIVFSMDIPGNITKAAKGEEIGTIVRGE